MNLLCRLFRRPSSLDAQSAQQRYDELSKASSARIVARFSRGNVALQRGSCMTEQDLRQKSRDADTSMRKIRNAIGFTR